LFGPAPEKVVEAIQTRIYFNFLHWYSHIKVLFWLIHVAVSRNGYMYQVKGITCMLIHTSAVSLYKSLSGYWSLKLVQWTLKQWRQAHLSA